MEASLCFFMQILMATIVPEHILFLLSISDENRELHPIAYSPECGRNEGACRAIGTRRNIDGQKSAAVSLSTLLREWLKEETTGLVDP